MADAKTLYLQRHCIPELIDGLIMKLMDEEPGDPRTFLARNLLAGEKSSGGNCYCVQMCADVEAERLFAKLDFDAIGDAKITGDGKTIGSLRDPIGTTNLTEKQIGRNITEYERSYKYSLGDTNSLGVKGFVASMKVLNSTHGNTPSCFVSWTASWDQPGELASLSLPEFVRNTIEAAIASCSN
eukprot:TRINITY_DN18454_c0_g1_i1.p1 TRINITY_DN18454_c0_g1~~TRINITY_DN18454_c0_g1_i1.p1  ORF type:complete len:184 (+),score=21.18 TRINITY_DN18454_c0_g1_i1:63-614(+)